jgi:hypothetical protein
VDLAAIIRVDRAGRIEHRDAVMQHEPGAGTDLAFDPSGEREGETGGDGGARQAR